MDRRAFLAAVGLSGSLPFVARPAFADADPGISDTCLSLDPGPNPWWENAAVGLLDPASEYNENNQYKFVYTGLKQGYPYKWMVNVTGITDCQFPKEPGKAPTLTVDFYVGNPALAMVPDVNAKKVGTVVTGNVPVGASNWVQADPAQYWKPQAASGGPGDPLHQCLVARVYPTVGQSPDKASFHIPASKHSAQRNVTLAGVRAGSMFDFRLTTALERETPSGGSRLRVAVAGETGARPLLTGMSAAMRRLGYQRLAIPPRGSFGLEAAPGFLMDARSFVDERSRTPVYEAVSAIVPGRAYELRFKADLRAAEKGSGRVFRITHADAAGVVRGGHTVVVVAV